MTKMRLARYLSQAGVAARRKAEILIEEGRVKVNGKVVTNVATNVDADSARVQVDGEGVQLEDLLYVILNKPGGCVSTVSDPEGRATVMDYLPTIPVAVKPVGRLDYHSEGVLLLTNDGELAAALLSPAKHVEKTYHVKAQGQIPDADIERLRKGVRLDRGRKTKEAQVDRLKAKSKHDWLVITLSEGKNRQIHRMLEALGHRVAKIQRVAFGGITYHGLRVGDARELDASELKQLRQQVGLKANPRSNPRGKWKVRREDTDRARRARAKELDEAEGVVKPKRRAPKAAPRGRSGARGKTAARAGRPAAKKPAGKRTAKPAAKRTAKPAGKRTAKPAGKRTAKPAGKRTAKPAGKRTAKPAGKRTAKPAGKRTAKPAGKRTASRASKSAPRAGKKRK